MSEIMLQLATLVMIDRERGDLYAVITSSGSYVVQIDHPFKDRRTTSIPGYVFFDEHSQPTVLRLAGSNDRVSCRPFTATPHCPNCMAHMRIIDDEYFVCTECDTELI